VRADSSKKWLATFPKVEYLKGIGAVKSNGAKNNDQVHQAN